MNSYKWTLLPLKGRDGGRTVTAAWGSQKQRTAWKEGGGLQDEYIRDSIYTQVAPVYKNHMVIFNLFQPANFFFLNVPVKLYIYFGVTEEVLNALLAIEITQLRVVGVSNSGVGFAHRGGRGLLAAAQGGQTFGLGCKGNFALTSLP